MPVLLRHFNYFEAWVDATPHLDTRAFLRELPKAK
jgi:hypothetical protein